MWKNPKNGETTMGKIEILLDHIGRVQPLGTTPIPNPITNSAHKRVTNSISQVFMPTCYQVVYRKDFVLDSPTRSLNPQVSRHRDTFSTCTRQY